MNLSLENRKWKPFIFNDIFDITSTSSGIDKNKLTNIIGQIPYITRSDKNNGIDMFIGKQVNKRYKKNSNNVITIGLDTQTVFYQSCSFYTGQNIQIINNDWINKNTALFLIPLIKIQMEKFNWGGNGATLTRLKRSKILLPVNSKGKPDYAFMESYMKAKEAEVLAKYKERISAKIQALRINKEKLRDDVKWKAFLFPDVFEIKNGFYNKKPVPSGKGVIPFLGATQANNGITEFYTLEEIKNNSKTGKGKNESIERKLFKGNCIAVTNNGSVGFAYYQIADFTCSHDINPLYLKGKTLNSYIAKFLITAIEQQKVCFEYARKWRPMRMRKSQILLPVNDKNEPDYEYMEQYMKNLEAKKLERYYEYKLR